MRFASHPKPERGEGLQVLPGLDAPRRVILAGDTHGDANHVRYLLQQAVKSDSDAVFVLGDFGIWDHMDDGKFTDAVSKFSKTHHTPVYFLPGNHDNYDLLFEYEATKPRDEDGFVVLKPGVLYSPRGHRWTWNGIHFMSLGGAYSIDAPGRLINDMRRMNATEFRIEQGHTPTERDEYLMRYRQWSWWKQEEISQEELDFALRPGPVDVLLTHDKPRNVDPGWHRKDIEACHENQEAIQEVVDAKKPKLLVHGHLHFAYGCRSDETMVYGLDCDPDASQHTGGSGDKAKSHAVLDLFSSDVADSDGIRLERYVGKKVPGTEIEIGMESYSTTFRVGR